MDPTHSRVPEEVRKYYRTVSRYIDLELEDRGDEVLWRSLVQEGKRPRILELGMGTGRATSVLAEGAGTVVGVDLSRTMIVRAHRRLGAHPRVHLVAADMRHLPLQGRFDLAVAASDPFTHLITDTGRDRALGEISRCLRPGGRFVLDTYWLPSRDLRAAAEPEGLVRKRTLGRPEEGLEVREHWRCRGETLRCTARYEYFRHGELEGEASFRARLWTAEELRRRLARHGLGLRNLWGDYERSPWDPETATHRVAEAIRRPRRSGDGSVDPA